MNFIDTLCKWQALAGSILGGIFALSTALIVAHSVRRREELSAAMLVTATLAAVRVESETLSSLSAREGVTEESYPLWFAEKVSHLHPSMPIMFDASVARLMSVDDLLAAHLGLFQHIYSQTELLLKRISEDYEHYHKNGKPFRPQEVMKADCRVATKHFYFAAEHANCAIYLISKLVLSKAALFYRLRRLIWHNKEERECMKLLKEPANKINTADC